jgi:hypothetical protein
VIVNTTKVAPISTLAFWSAIALSWTWCYWIVRSSIVACSG